MSKVNKLVTQAIKLIKAEFQLGLKKLSTIESKDELLVEYINKLEQLKEDTSLASHMNKVSRQAVDTARQSLRDLGRNSKEKQIESANRVDYEAFGTSDVTDQKKPENFEEESDDEYDPEYDPIFGAVNIADDVVEAVGGAVSGAFAFATTWVSYLKGNDKQGKKVEAEVEEIEEVDVRQAAVEAEVGPQASTTSMYAYLQALLIPLKALSTAAGRTEFLEAALKPKKVYEPLSAEDTQGVLTTLVTADIVRRGNLALEEMRALDPVSFNMVLLMRIQRMITSGMDSVVVEQLLSTLSDREIEYFDLYSPDRGTLRLSIKDLINMPELHLRGAFRYFEGSSDLVLKLASGASNNTNNNLDVRDFTRAFIFIRIFTYLSKNVKLKPQEIIDATSEALVQEILPTHVSDNVQVVTSNERKRKRSPSPSLAERQKLMTELFTQVDVDFNKIKTFFEASSKKTLTFNRSGFREAAQAVQRLQVELERLKKQFIEDGDFDAFKQGTDAGVKNAHGVIDKQHDTSHDMYRGLQVLFNDLLKNIASCFVYLTQQVGVAQTSDVNAEKSNWITPEETTRSLSEKAKKNLHAFFDKQAGSLGADTSTRAEEAGDNPEAKRAKKNN